MDIPALGSFQDGGLRDNFAGGITYRVTRQVWPLSRGPARMLSLGTGTAAKSQDGPSPHFRHIFKDGFLPRAFYAWMSSMDTESKWKEMKSQLDESIAEDYRRFNVLLQDIQVAIDDVEAMDRYRNLVTVQRGSGKSAKEAAVELLISRFFFVLDAIPDSTSTPIWCHGTIRCKGPIQELLPTLQRLLPQTLDFSTDTEPLGHLLGQRAICPACGRYCRPVSFPIHHFDDIINIYLRAGRQQRWRINGFPARVASFIDKQGLSSPFGRPDHGHPGTQPCDACDVSRMPFRGRRRKRTERQSIEEQARKRVCIVVTADPCPDGKE